MTERTERNRRSRSRPPQAKYQPLVALALAVAAGILADRYAALPLGLWWGAGLVALLAWLGLWLGQRNALAAIVLLLAASALGGAWHHQQWNLFAHDHVGRFAQEASHPVCVEAVALRSPHRIPPPPPDPLQMIPRAELTKVDVEVTRLRDGAAWRRVSGRVSLVVGGPLVEIGCGDRLLVYAKLVAPPPARNPGEFDMATYLRADRRLCQLKANYAAGVSVLDTVRPWTLRRLINDLRQYSRRLFDRHLSPRYAGLAGAVLLGSREQLDPEQTEAFFETGTIHILVVSGMNVGMLAGALWFVLRRARLPRFAAVLAVVGVAFLYMLLTDSEPPIVRATVLVLGACLASAFGRPTLAFNTLAAAALVVLVIRPHDLFSVSAQLSFLCVAGLVWFGPLNSRKDLERQERLARLIDQADRFWRRGLRYLGRAAWEMTCTGFVVWLLVLPMLMARFHLITPLGPFLTTLLWLPVEVIMISGFVLLLVGWFPFLGWLCGGLCNLALWAMDSTVAAAKQIPHSCQWTPGPDDWWLLGFYGGIAVAAMFPRLRPPRRWCGALLSVWIIVGFGLSLGRQPSDRLECTFLSVDHGLAVVLRLPSGQTVLYDAGEYGSGRAASAKVSAFLWSQGIVHLDAVIISHPDADHYNALPDLFERFTVGAIYVSPVMFRESNRAIDYLRGKIEATRAPVAVLHAGDRIRDNAGCTLRVLHPPAGGIPYKDNANSIVLAVEYAGRCMLLTGDLEFQGLDMLLAMPSCPCDVVLAPHHGSRRSQPERLLAWAAPQWAVVSSGPMRSYEAAETIYAAAKCRVLYTALQGAIHVRISLHELGLYTFRDLPTAASIADTDEPHMPQQWVL